MNNWYRNYLLLFLTATLLFASYSCSYNKGEAINPTVCNIAITHVSFSNDIQPILTTNCTTGGCHLGSTPSGNLNLEASQSYAALSKPGKGYIDTINPQFSVLYSSLVSTSSPMPPIGQQPLSACDLMRIKIWMQEGAKNN